MAEPRDAYEAHPDRRKHLAKITQAVASVEHDANDATRTANVRVGAHRADGPGDLVPQISAGRGAHS
jgi:hypothetical protein